MSTTPDRPAAGILGGNDSIKLQPSEHVITAWAEPCSGPGWSNQPIWVLIRDSSSNKHRVACLQPDEQGRDLAVLYDASAAIHRSMCAAVKRLINTQK